MPTPVELGKAKYNALPIRSFIGSKYTLDDLGSKYTWDDWREEVKQKYPIKYFFNETFPYFLYTCYSPFKFIFDYLKYNFIPKHRYHILDLRQSETQCDTYRWGYSDPRERMLYACFNLLKYFVENELHPIETRIKEYEQLLQNTEDEKNILKTQLDFYKEILSLYEWWNYVRKVEYEEKQVLYHINKEKWLEACTNFDKKEQEMFLKLCSLRESLWT